MSRVERRRTGPARWLLLLCGLALLTSCSQEPLTAADPNAEMPVPRKSSTSFTTTRMRDIEAPVRREVKGTVPADISDVLAFYRVELGKRNWQEKPDDAVVTADRVRLTYTSPKGPALLTLQRATDQAKGKTEVSLVQRNAEAAAKADILPMSGQARLVFGYLVPDVASLVINDQTIKIAGGENHPQMLDLPPGTYSYELLVSGRRVRTDTITLASGEAWSLHDDRKPSQVY